MKPPSKAAARAGFHKQMLEAKIAEHVAFASFGDRAGADRARLEAAAHLEAYFDQFEVLAKECGC